MATSPAMPAAARHDGSLALALPVTVGVVYGVWAAFIDRRSGELTSSQIWLGVVAGLVMAGLCLLLGRTQSALPRELRAAAYGVLAGVSTGFLHSLTGESVLRCTGVGLGFAAAFTAGSFYVFYTRES